MLFVNEFKKKNEVKKNMFIVHQETCSVQMARYAQKINCTHEDIKGQLQKTAHAL